MEIYFVGDRPAQVIYAVPHSECFYPNNFTFEKTPKFMDCCGAVKPFAYLYKESFKFQLSVIGK